MEQAGSCNWSQRIPPACKRDAIYETGAGAHAEQLIRASTTVLHFYSSKLAVVWTSTEDRPELLPAMAYTTKGTAVRLYRAHVDEVLCHRGVRG